MTGKRSRRSDDSRKRQNFPRRCKDVQPYYAIDTAEFDDDDSSMSKNNNDDAESSRIVHDKPGNQREDNSTIISWLISMSLIKDNDEIKYRQEINGMVLGKGHIHRGGIMCDCCKENVSVAEFAEHSGDHNTDKPYDNIYIGGTGVSLLTSQMEAWNNHPEKSRGGYHHHVKKPKVRDHHDDSCLICADGGKLICCEKCPSTYHPKSCMGLEDVPNGEWHCFYCHCKYCDTDASVEMLLTCSLCQKKYHWTCSEEKDQIPLNAKRPGVRFCGSSCWKLHHKLEELVGRSMNMGDGFSWTIIRRINRDSRDKPDDQELHQIVKCNSMVVLAAKLVEESFNQIVDRQTRTNIIQSVIYNCGSNLARTNFCSFYTAVVEYKDQIVCAASLRMPSPKLAEMPFIATREKWRNLGLCRNLLSAITSVLHDMGVERIVIPSADEMVEKWKQKFGFLPLDETMEKEITSLNTVMFPKTTRLYKWIRDPRQRLMCDLNLPPEEED